MTEQERVKHTPDVIIDPTTLGLPHDIRPMYDMLVREADTIVGTHVGTGRRIVDIAGNNNPWDFRVLLESPAEARAAREAKQARLVANPVDNQNQ